MNNNINEISFKADVKVLTELPSKRKLKKVIDLVKQGTQEYPNDTLYITKTPYKTYSLHLSNTKHGDFYTGAEIFTEGLDQELKNSDEKKLAQKLINAFKALYLQKENSSKG